LFAYAARRVLATIPLMMIATLALFAMVASVRDPVAELRVSCPRCDDSAYESLIELYDLDKPVLDVTDPLNSRYLAWLSNVVTGDLGTSTSQGENPVGDIVWTRFKNTLILAVPAFLVIAFTATSLGVYSAIRQYSKTDYLITGVSFLGIAMPTFFFGLLLQVFWGIWFQDWTGRKPFYTSQMHDNSMLELVQSATLPIVTLTLVIVATESRFVRASMLEVINSDYIRTARAKGLSEGKVIFKHALRNALIPLVTIWALDFAALLGGSVVTETIFSWPGLGPLLLTGIFGADVHLTMAIVLLISILAIGFNLLADLLYGVLDPRIRIG
jgi:ABC-type dipeptide/oligopeptide/nickel transport system permease component